MAHKIEQRKRHKQRAVESHRSRVKQDQGDTRKSSRTPPWGQGATQGGHRHVTTRQQRHSVHVCYKCRHATDRSQTQEPNLSDIKKYESMSFQEGSTRASFKADAVAKLRAELEQVQQDLPQPLPRNTFVKKDKEAKAIMQELSEKTSRMQNLAALKQHFEDESNDFRKRLEEAERRSETLLSARSVRSNPAT